VLHVLLSYECQLEIMSVWTRLLFTTVKLRLMSYQVFVVSICTIVNLRHCVNLAPLFGSVYIIVPNCVCYVMFM